MRQIVGIGAVTLLLSLFAAERPAQADTLCDPVSYSCVTVTDGVASVGVTSLPPGTASRTYRGGTIALGGTAQTPGGVSGMVANAGRRGCEFQNQSNSDLWINDAGGVATPSQPNIWLPPGAYYLCPPNGVSPSAFSIFGATTGQPFAAWEW